MNRLLALLAFCAAPIAAAEPLPSLDAFLRQARAQSAPASVAGAPLLSLSVQLRHSTISDLKADVSGFVNKDYQLGDEWGKLPVTAGSVGRESAVFQRAAKATAHYGGGTAFYLGVFNGHHLMATNHHVIEHYRCGYSAEFTLLGKSFPCEKLYGDWAEVDLALFSIKVAPEEEAALAGLGRNFAFDAQVYPGQELLTIGFGVANNPKRGLMANQDADCRVFSGRDEFRKMPDPDDFNPGPDKVWSFASGCDISHGDSGSAFVDRDTGDVLGLVWTGRIPKSPKVQSSKYLAELQRANSPEIWTELSYTVPAAAIGAQLTLALQDGTMGGDEARTIRALLAGPGTALASR